MDELGAELYGRRAAVVSYTMYSPADAIARLEDDRANAEESEVARRREASRTGADYDDVSRVRHG
jgi:hypothetical protein